MLLKNNNATKDDKSILNSTSLNHVELMNKLVLVMNQLIQENYEMVKSAQELTS